MVAFRVASTFLAMTMASPVVIAASSTVSAPQDALAALKQATSDVSAKEFQEKLSKALGGLEEMYQGYRSDDRRRELQFQSTRACGEVITTTTADEISALADFYVSTLFSDPGQAGLADLARTTLFSEIKYDIQVVKLCKSCADMTADQASATRSDSDGAGSQYNFDYYCSADMYGYDAVSPN